MKILSALFALATLTAIALADPLAVGAPAPEVTAKDQDGKAINFKEVYSKGTTLVYFYPKAATPGCTKQGCSLRDNWKGLQAQGIQVLGVSGDTTDDQKKFRDAQKFPFPLVADDDGKVAAAFGVPEIKPHVFKRMSFLVKDGKIAWTMTEKTSTEMHATDVMKAAQDLK